MLYEVVMVGALTVFLGLMALAVAAALRLRQQNARDARVQAQRTRVPLTTPQELTREAILAQLEIVLIAVEALAGEGRGVWTRRLLLMIGKFHTMLSLSLHERDAYWLAARQLRTVKHALLEGPRPQVGYVQLATLANLWRTETKLAEVTANPAKKLFFSKLVEMLERTLGDAVAPSAMRPNRLRNST